MRTRWLILVGAALTLALSGCQPLDEPPAPAGPPPVGDAASVEALPVAAWAPMTGYKRERFPHWSSQGDGCDTRDVVLKRDGQAVVADTTCRITSGTWVSPYDGRSTGDPQDLDIDHMVPLANAWRTGAATWTDEQRGLFANDLGQPQLIAVTASTNRSKGDQDPSQWRPPREEYWCTYARDWVAVKSYWGLSVTTDEKTALVEMLGTCT